MVNTITGIQNSIIQSIKTTQRVIDNVQLALASGRDVNSAIDGPQNFFAAKGLSSQANDLTRLLDGIGLNIRAIQAANAGLEALLKLLDQAEALIEDAIVTLFADAAQIITPAFISGLLAANNGLTYSSDTESFYRLVTANANWATANANALIATLNQPKGLSNVAGVTGHLAAITSQEENDFLQALIVDRTWIGANDIDIEGQWVWSGGPEDGQQFWQGVASGNNVNNLYSNWNVGEPNQFGGNEDVAELRTDGLWNDLSGTALQDSVIEWDSSLFGSNDPGALVNADKYKEQYLQILEQIDQLVEDAHLSGLKLLDSKDLITYFNASHSSSLKTEGIDATSLGLGLATRDLTNITLAYNIIDEIKHARQVLRSYSSSIQIDLGIILTRQDFTRATINALKAGADDLTIADQNQKGAELLALNVRQQIQFTALALSNKNTAADLFL